MDSVINFEDQSRRRSNKSERRKLRHKDSEKGNVILFTGVRIQYQKSLDRALPPVRSAKTNNADR